jgi:hypothetical protein
LDWTFGVDTEQKVTSIEGSSDIQCPDEIKEKQIQHDFVKIQCEKYPGHIESPMENS